MDNIEIEKNESESDSPKQEDIKIDKKSKILFVVFAVLILVSVVATYYRIMIKRDYLIEAKIDCDPLTEGCFVYECDPDYEECTGNPDEDTSYYKLIRKNASRIEICDSRAEECNPLVCEINEPDCEIISCAEETSDGGSCSEPESVDTTEGVDINETSGAEMPAEIVE